MRACPYDHPLLPCFLFEACSLRRYAVLPGKRKLIQIEPHAVLALHSFIPYPPWRLHIKTRHIQHNTEAFATTELTPDPRIHLGSRNIDIVASHLARP